MEPPVSDWDLFAHAADDDAALSALYERHRGFTLRVAWGVLNEDAAAEDVAQDVFLRLGDGRLKAKPRARFTTWLYAVTINCAREHARRRRKLWGDADAETALAATPDARSDPARVETLADLGRALSALPLRQREVVVLRFLEGLDTAETAEVLGCRPGAVKAHLHRAAAKLRTVLSAYQAKDSHDEETDADRRDSDVDRSGGARRSG